VRKCCWKGGNGAGALPRSAPEQGGSHWPEGRRPGLPVKASTSVQGAAGVVDGGLDLAAVRMMPALPSRRARAGPSL